MTYTFSASGLPPGLTLVSGIVSGTPTTAGNYTVTFTVSDGVSSVSNVVSIAISGAAVPIPFWQLILGADCGSYSLDSARAQLQAFAEAGSYWRDSVAILPVFVAESGSYWLDSVTTSPLFVAESGSYWLDSADAAIAESGSYWLDSVESPVFVAESGVYWLDSAEASPLFVTETGSYWLDSAEASPRNTTLLNALSYAALNNSSYGYYDSNTNMPALYDGNLNGGMMAISFAGTEAVYIQVQLSASSYLNQIAFYGGQFNGGFNIPDSIKVYAGLVAAGTVATPIYSGSLANTVAVQNISLADVAALNTPVTQFTIAFAKNGTFDGTIAVNELQFKGHI